MGFFPKDSWTSSNSRGKRAISVRVIEILLYITISYLIRRLNTVWKGVKWNTIKGQWINQLNHFAIAGLLIKSAKFIKKEGHVMEYEKTGGFRQAAKDFAALKIENVNDLRVSIDTKR